MSVGRGEEELRCRCEGCGKVSRNEVGIVMHEKRMHRVNKKRGRLECERFGRGFDALRAESESLEELHGEWEAYGRREIGNSTGDVRGGLAGKTMLRTFGCVGGWISVGPGAVGLLVVG